MGRRIAITAIITVFIAVLWFGWILLLFNGSISKIVGNASYQNLGAFGDAFGAISSLMAMIAAIGAYLTFQSQNDAIRLERFERNLFTLMAQQESIIGEIVVTILKDGRIKRKNPARYPRFRLVLEREIENQFFGRRALLVTLFMLRDSSIPDDYKDTKIIGRKFDDLFNKYVNNLGHYFRSTYHIFKYIDEKCPSDREYYSRIVRAKLSQAELCLIGYNCIVGLGRGKFTELVERYSILHNLYEEDDDWGMAEFRFMRRKLSANSFRYEDPEPVTY